MPDSTPPAADGQLEARLRAALAPNLLLVREIGAGGMARVFLAREPALKRLVAVKVLSGELANTDAGRVRFEREAQAVAGLSHPNVVAVHTVGELDDGTPYFIMQYVEGHSLSERIAREGTISIAEARRALGEVAAALAAAHAQGIIHRDVKPANILYEEATGRSLVSDFGIAAVGESAAPVNVKLTATGSILGTPQYMSPEQLLAEPVTEKTDVYSLGLLAHEMLCGSPPFKGSSPHELIAAHLRDVPAKLSVRRLDVDAELDAIVASCLEKNASQRPAAAEVAKRLTPGGGALLEWPAPGLDELLGALRRISAPAMFGGTAVTLVVLGILAAGVTINSALTSAATLLMLIAGVAGMVPLIVALSRAVRVGNTAARAIRNGYAWMTVLETMADVRGDTGNLIAASREYSGLKPAERDRYRLDRVRREVALLAGGFVAVPLLVVVLLLGSTDMVSWPWAWLSLAAPAAGLLVSIVTDVREHRAFASRRGRRAVASTDVSRLSSPWYETFEDVRKGQNVGRGGSKPANAGRWTALSVAVLLTAFVLLLMPLAVVGTIGPSFWSIVFPKFMSTKEKVRMSNLTRPYSLPRDSSIAAIDAGRALYSLTGQQSRRLGGPPGDFPERPVPTQLPPVPWAGVLPPDLFPTARPNEAAGLPTSLKVIASVIVGANARELAFLQGLAAAPQWKLFDLVARAPSMDYMGARFLPFGEEASAGSIPILPYAAAKDLAYANVSRAAYYLARGRRDSAEFVLRSGVSFGFQLIDASNTILDQLIGAVVVGVNRNALIDYYKGIGDPRGQMIRAQLDSVIASVDSREAESTNRLDFDPGNIRALRAAIMRDAEDRSELRAIRFEMLRLLALTPCTNMRELVFGMSPEVKAVFARQRAKLTRFPSDSALFDLILHQTEVPPREGSHWTLMSRSSRIVGALLRNKRVPGCVGVLSAFSQ